MSAFVGRLPGDVVDAWVEAGLLVRRDSGNVETVWPGAVLLGSSRRRNGSMMYLWGRCQSGRGQTAYHFQDQAGGTRWVPFNLPALTAAARGGHPLRLVQTPLAALASACLPDGRALPAVAMLDQVGWLDAPAPEQIDFLTAVLPDLRRLSHLEVVADCRADAMATQRLHLSADNCTQWLRARGVNARLMTMEGLACAGSSLADALPRVPKPSQPNAAPLSGSCSDPLVVGAERSGLAEQIADLAAERLTAKQIAKRLDVGVDTVVAVRSHRGIPSWTLGPDAHGRPIDNPAFVAWRRSHVVRTRLPASEASPAMSVTAITAAAVLPAMAPADVEQMAIGCILAHPDLHDLVPRLRGVIDRVSSPAHADLLRALISVHASGRPVEIGAVFDDVVACLTGDAQQRAIDELTRAGDAICPLSEARERIQAWLG